MNPSSRVTAEPRSLDRLLQPRSVAVVGATEHSGFTSRIVRNLVRFRGTEGVYPVNPKYERLHDLPCYPSIAHIPAPPDLAIVGVAARSVPVVLEHCASRGVGGVQVISAGYSEVGAGAGLQRELAEWSRATGIPLSGPNCLGLLHAPSRLMAMPAPMELLVPGRVGLVTQSGSFGPMVSSMLFARGIGITFAITGGNEAALDLADYLRYLVGDEHTEVIGCFVEQIRRPERFAEVCRMAADRRKPIVMLKIGRSEVARRAALAHTGSLTGADAVVDAMLAKLGVARVGSVDELVETIAAFHQRRLPRGSGVATVHLSGGVATLTSDVASAAGLHMPALDPATADRLRGVVKGYGTVGNPLDLTGQVTFEPDVMRDALGVLAGSPRIDVIVYGSSVAITMDRRAPVAVALQDAAARYTDVRFFFLAAENGRHVHVDGVDPDRRLEFLDGVPLLQGSEYGLRAIAALIRYADFQRARALLPSTGRRAPLEAAKAARRMLEGRPGRTIPEREAKNVLALYGIRAPRESLATTAEEAVATAEAIGFPVALKVASADVPHKTDVGGVVLDLGSATVVRAAFARLVDSVARAVPSARIDGVLVAEMVHPGIEMLVGVSRDPQMGLSMTCGIGGVLVEVLNDTQVMIPPLSEPECRSSLGRLRGRAVLEGARGAAPADIDALVDVLLRMSDLCGDVGDLIEELEINPLAVFPEHGGARALDCLIRTTAHDPSPVLAGMPR